MWTTCPRSNSTVSGWDWTRDLQSQVKRPNHYATEPVKRFNDEKQGYLSCRMFAEADWPVMPTQRGWYLQEPWRTSARAQCRSSEHIETCDPTFAVQRPCTAASRCASSSTATTSRVPQRTERSPKTSSSSSSSFVYRQNRKTRPQCRKREELASKCKCKPHNTCIALQAAHRRCSSAVQVTDTTSVQPRGRRLSLRPQIDLRPTSQHTQPWSAVWRSPRP